MAIAFRDPLRAWRRVCLRRLGGLLLLAPSCSLHSGIESSAVRLASLPSLVVSLLPRAGAVYSVEFQFSRTQMRRQHQAVRLLAHSAFAESASASAEGERKVLLLDCSSRWLKAVLLRR